jgi:hypothetical protein
MVDPRETFEAARGHAHRARKSAGRLALSGLGFSVAYFFDPDHGAARRKQAVELVNHVWRAKAQLQSRRQPPATATTGLGAVAPLRGVTNQARTSAGS